MKHRIRYIRILMLKQGLIRMMAYYMYNHTINRVLNRKSDEYLYANLLLVKRVGGGNKSKCSLPFCNLFNWIDPPTFTHAKCR